MKSIPADSASLITDRTSDNGSETAVIHPLHNKETIQAIFDVSCESPVQATMEVSIAAYDKNGGPLNLNPVVTPLPIRCE